ncbi:MAG: hypothetical protein KAS12_07445, partial [Candidatus Aenigmarchaeota archaeon]|nr:hypothetical protein [Candidatus Aenigmarchaeota archaeon]
NSLIYWMDGETTNNRHGIVPAKILDYLISDNAINFFGNHHSFVKSANFILPTGKRKFFLKQDLKKLYQKIIDS